MGESNTSLAELDEKCPSLRPSWREGEVMSRSKDGVLRTLRSNEDVLAFLSKDETLACLSNEVTLPCLKLSSVGLRVREDVEPFTDFVFRRPNSSKETPPKPPPPPPPSESWLLDEGVGSLRPPLSHGEKNRQEGEGSRYRPECKM